MQNYVVKTALGIMLAAECWLSLEAPASAYINLPNRQRPPVDLRPMPMPGYPGSFPGNFPLPAYPGNFPGVGPQPMPFPPYPPRDRFPDFDFRWKDKNGRGGNVQLGPNKGTLELRGKNGEILNLGIGR